MFKKKETHALPKMQNPLPVPPRPGKVSLWHNGRWYLLFDGNGNEIVCSKITLEENFPESGQKATIQLPVEIVNERPHQRLLHKIYLPESQENAYVEAIKEKDMLTAENNRLKGLIMQRFDENVRDFLKCDDLEKQLEKCRAALKKERKKVQSISRTIREK